MFNAVVSSIPDFSFEFIEAAEVALVSCTGFVKEQYRLLVPFFNCEYEATQASYSDLEAHGAIDEASLESFRSRVYERAISSTVLLRTYEISIWFVSFADSYERMFQPKTSLDK